MLTKLFRTPEIDGFGDKLRSFTQEKYQNTIKRPGNNPKFTTINHNK